MRVPVDVSTDLGQNVSLSDVNADRSKPSPVPTDLLSSTLEPEAFNSTRPLILFAYFETETARTNLEFFLTHALHDGADFLFILNGDTDAAAIIPDEPNIWYVQRENNCFDLGAFAEVLIATELYKKHDRFIMMNASIRGPFLPYYADGCWSDMYLDKVTEKVKVQSSFPPHTLVPFLQKSVLTL